MDRDEFLYLAPYFVSLILSGAIVLYAWQHRHIRGARPYSWLVVGQTLATLGFVLELVSTDIETKIFWDTFQQLTTAFLVILPFLVFAVQISEQKLPSLMLGTILTFLGIFAAFLLTDDIHHLFYAHPRLTTEGPYPELRYDFTWPNYAYLLFYVYGANLYGITLLLKRAFQPRSPFRPQFLILAFSFLIPLIFSFLTLANIQLAPQRDLSPLASTVGGLIAAWGLFRYGLFDIVPIARELLFETLMDPVIVLDPKNRITDINRAALTLLGKERDEILGHTPKVVLAKWPSLIEVIDHPFTQKKEVSISRDHGTLFFEVTISPILENNRDFVGRLLTAHEVTRLKEWENDHRSLTEEMEQRIEERIREGHDVADRYRDIVEGHSDFILRWKPDGTRTFVNEAYCRYWDITLEQALAKNFLFHTAEENRPDIEENISRLESGDAEIITEIYQVTKPDGSPAWQEWTDTAIRDEWGKLIEIQSVGRDITDRKRLEEA